MANMIECTVSFLYQTNESKEHIIQFDEGILYKNSIQLIQLMVVSGNGKYH